MMFAFLADGFDEFIRDNQTAMPFDAGFRKTDDISFGFFSQTDIFFNLFDIMPFMQFKILNRGNSDDWFLFWHFKNIYFLHSIPRLEEISI